MITNNNNNINNSDNKNTSDNISKNSNNHNDNNKSRQWNGKFIINRILHAHLGHLEKMF